MYRNKKLKLQDSLFFNISDLKLYSTVKLILATHRIKRLPVICDPKSPPPPKSISFNFQLN
jgi:hypothetical protein